MSWRANLADEVGGRTVVDENFAVKPSRGKEITRWRITNGLHKSIVLLFRHSEWRKFN